MFEFKKINVMISSRSITEILYNGEKSNLSKVRIALKKEIEAERLFDEKELFEVSIHEDAPAPGADTDVWEASRKEVKKSHIVIVLFTGEAGSAESDDAIGICHAELKAAMDTMPDKVRMIKLPDAKPKNKSEAERNKKFKEYVKNQMPMWAEAKNGEEAIKEAKRALRQAVAELTIRGSKKPKSAKFDFGEALDWSRLNFEERQHRMVAAIEEGLGNRNGSSWEGDKLFIMVKDTFALCICSAIPSSLTVPAARELVGQPFLSDYKYAHLIKDDRSGPVHFIACHHSVTEAQAMRLLGFPDATIVPTSFGVYVADNIQKIQLIFLANCIDETTTQYKVQEVFAWFKKTREDENLANRAKARRRIIEAIAKEVQSG
ncbi:MAG: hypothetical protein PHQ34_13450 [Methanothrix sp.]|nr:hypothetical protein [Methanothrix sp.]